MRQGGILGDQGLVRVFLTLVMSCQNDWNGKHRPRFNEVRLLKEHRMRRESKKKMVGR